ncbi:hypothetical protein FS749_013037 [Ceratobasidium sp. UAMH 11750]|nr:hypothetical protein FS749_013037 [Ceratobasidium sp. UAMH 11750]
MTYNRTAEKRNDPSIKAWRGRCGFIRHLHPKPKCKKADCPVVVLLPPPTRLRLAIVIGAPGVFSGPGGSSTGGHAESNATTREHSLPLIATLEDEENEDEGEDESEDEGDEEMEDEDGENDDGEDEDGEDEDWEVKNREDEDWENEYPEEDVEEKEM